MPDFRPRDWTAPLRDPAAFRDLLRHLTLGAGIIGLIMSVLFGAGFTTPPDPDEGPDCAYIDPAPSDQVRLEKMRSEVYKAIQELRAEEFVPPVALGLAERQFQAQRWAERSACLGVEEPTPENVSMIQVNLPVEGASGHAIVDAWLHSEAHTAVILDPDHVFAGIGIAQADDRVWVAVQFF